MDYLFTASQGYVCQPNVVGWKVYGLIWVWVESTEVFQENIPILEYMITPKGRLSMDDGLPRNYLKHMACFINLTLNLGLSTFIWTGQEICNAMFTKLKLVLKESCRVEKGTQM